ncbi:MAG: isopropylmalate isomerase [Paracoccaceae bacterium]
MPDQSILACTLARWLPRMGDPNLMAWITVLIYALAAAASLRAARGVRHDVTPVARREWWFWTLAAVLLALYAVNKQLDGQAFATALARCTAKAQGWYGHRHPLQIAFIALLAAGAVAAFVAVSRRLSGTLGRTGLAAFGLVFVTAFILIRAVGFQHLDRLLHLKVAGVRANLLLEIPGPLLVAAGAALSRIAARARRAPRSPT